MTVSKLLFLFELHKKLTIVYSYYVVIFLFQMSLFNIPKFLQYLGLKYKSNTFFSLLRSVGFYKSLIRHKCLSWMYLLYCKNFLSQYSHSKVVKSFLIISMNLLPLAKKDHNNKLSLGAG